MESLESKLDRLPPGKRKEIEDFVDFLLSRTVPGTILPETAGEQFSVLDTAPPPLPLPEHISGKEYSPLLPQDPALEENRPITPIGEEIRSPFHEIGGGVQDQRIHDYMDYGQFEPPSSPATEAVKKVRRRIITREKEERPHHLLDWVD